MQRATIFTFAAACGAAAFVWSLIARPDRPAARTGGFRSIPTDRARDIPTMQAAIRANPADYDALYVLATLRQAGTDPLLAAQAWRDLRDAAENVVTGGRPDEIRASFVLGWALEKLGDADGARTAITRAWEAYESLVVPGGRLESRYQAWMRLGWCRRKRGDEAGAQQAWDRAATILDQTHPTEATAAAMYDRACCRALLGESDMAMWALNQAVAKGFREFDWACADEHLAPLRKDPAFDAWLQRGRQLPRAPDPAPPTRGP